MTDMWAMELGAVGGPLRLVASALPNPGPGELLIKVAVCGVCRTDLHIVDGEVTAVLPIIPGHEIVGIVAAIGEGVTGFLPGDRIGVPWWVIAVAAVTIAIRAVRICATRPVLPDVRATAVLRPMPSPMQISVSESPNSIRMKRRRHCFVRA